MSSFLICCFVLALTGSLTLAVEHPSEDKDDLDNVRALFELFSSYDSHRESLPYERKYDNVKESFTWKDCGGPGSVVHLKSFSISPLPLPLPGQATVALNATVDSDVLPPISVELIVKKKIGVGWVNVCSHVPGGCYRKNICRTQSKHEAAAAAEEEEDYTNPFCEMKRGDFNLPPTPFIITEKAPGGWYRFTATFRKERKRIGCIYVELDIA